MFNFISEQTFNPNYDIMSLSPTSSTVHGSGESSPTSTAQARTSPLPNLDTSSEVPNTFSPTSMSPDNLKSKLDEDMDSETSTTISTSAVSPNKPSDSNENRINGEYGLTSSPSLAAEGMEATNCRSPNTSRMSSSSSPLPATASPVPKTPNISTETQQQLANSVNVSPGRMPATNLNGSTSCIQSVTTDDLEEVLMELNSFDRQHTKEWKEKVPILIPPLLEGYLQFVAKGGNTHFSWSNIKGLFKVKVNQVISEFYSESPTDELPAVPNVESFDYSNVKEKLFQKLDTFSGIPFTVQRLAELLTSPKRHYRRTDKFLRALEKNMLVVSTVEARIAPPLPDQLSQFPPPHQLPTSLHSTTKSLNHNMFGNGPSADSEACNVKENDTNGPSSRLHESSSSERNGNGMLNSSHNSNTSPNRSLTALENNSSVLNVSPNQCANVTSGWNRSPNGDRPDKMNLLSKDDSKNEGDYEDEDEDEEEDEEDGEDIELNVDTPGDTNDIQSTTNCSSERIMNRKNLDNNTQNSISSSVECKENLEEAQTSSQNEFKITDGHEQNESGKILYMVVKSFYINFNRYSR